MQAFNQDKLNILRSEAKAALKKMRAKIDNPKISSEKRAENLLLFNRLRNYVEFTEDALKSLLVEIAENEKADYIKGVQAGRKMERENAAGGLPIKLFDKEAYRSSWELQKRNEWPELYN
ncbi:MAG: hypothetical protein IPP32_05320 [Bacteroidetes bacterium]|nr:hypothetical protein [Bacteroidota bacterium]